MKQCNFTYYDIRKAINDIPKIQEKLDTDPRQAILHIYVSGMSKKQSEILLNTIDKSLHNVCRIGISEFPARENKKISSININLILAEKSFFEHFYVMCSRGEERNIAYDFAKSLGNIQSIKAFEICSANHLTDTTEFIEAIGAAYPDVPIFGSLSKPARLANNTSVKLEDSFFIGDKIYTEGYSIVVYYGENLNVRLNYIQSWRPIGKEMNLTLEDNPIIGGTSVTKIDNVPSMDLYNKYFGIPQDKNFLKNAWYFPLLIKRNNINLCFTPIGSMNGNIYYSGRMYDYETAHFAYCTKEDILQTSREECKKIQSYKPEALMLIICCNRYAFMGEDEKQDLNYYSDCLEGMCYCHSFTEIAYKNNSGGALNSALVSISMRESHDDIIKDKSFFTRPKNHNFKSSVIPVSFILSHFFNEMTKELISYQNNLEEEVKRIHDENSNLSLHIVKTLAATIDAKDRYTNGHSERVAEYSKKIAKRYGYNKKQLNEIYMIALLHDVGKIGVPDYIINKKSKLTDDEYQVIKEHSEIGAFILGNIKEMPKLVTGARWHHERYDGSGYPDGLYGNHIPEIARIIAVADAYDAMTSNRSYRKSLSQAYVRNEIEKGKNKQFDPVFADIMLQIIDGDIDYTLRDHAGINENRMLQMGMDQIALPEKSDEAKHLSFSQLIDFGRSMPGGFFVYKAKDDEELLYVNDIVLDIYGCETINEFKSHTGFTFPGMVYEKDLDRIQNAITMQVKESTKQLDYVEYRIRRLDGEIRWVDDYGRLVNTIEFGDVYYVLIRDITDMHQERATLTDYDDLTKLFNRKHFDLIIHKKVIDILHLGGKLCLIMLDIDYFNNLVELYDTIYCNECICSISEIVKNSFHRKDDMVFRYGNDKFAVLLSNTDIDNALRIAERVRAGIRGLGLSNESSPLKIVTVSGGIAVLDGEEAGFLANPSGELIRLAENALHEAKKNGRDMIKVQKSEFCKLTP